MHPGWALMRTGLSTVPYLSVPNVFWPVEQAGQSLDYSLDIGRLALSGGGCLLDLVASGDSVASLTLAISPSGSGELQPSRLTLTDTLVTFWGTGGVAGRTYLILITVTMSSGRVFVIPTSLFLSPVLATWPPPIPPDWGFGDAVVWVYAPSLNFTIPRNAALRLWGWN